MNGRYGTSLAGRFGYQNGGLVYYGYKGRENRTERLMDKLEGEG